MLDQKFYVTNNECKKKKKGRGMLSLTSCPLFSVIVEHANSHSTLETPKQLCNWVFLTENKESNWFICSVEYFLTEITSLTDCFIMRQLQIRLWAWHTWVPPLSTLMTSGQSWKPLSLSLLNYDMGIKTSISWIVKKK